MASMQCHKPAEQTCSLDQKVSQISSQENDKTGYEMVQETEYHSQIQYTDHGMTKTQDRYSETQITQSQTKPVTHRGVHKKRGLFQKIKDSISGDSSSSDSESDDEKCRNRKN